MLQRGEGEGGQKGEAEEGRGLVGRKERKKAVRAGRGRKRV